MDQLKDIYKTLAKKEENLSFAYNMHVMHLLWRRTVDEQIRKNTEPYKIKNNTLFVLAASPVWAQQLTFLKGEIIAKLKAYPEGAAIEDIKFIAGDIKKEIKKKTPDALPGNIFADGKMGELIVDYEKKEQIQKSWGWVKCRQCGGYNKGRGEECFYCAKEKADDEEKKIYQALRLAPWVSTQEIMENIPGANEHKVEKARKRIAARLKDDIFVMVRELEKQKDRAKQSIFKIMAHEYVMHKSGLHPRQINEKIIRKYLSARALKQLNPGEEAVAHGKKRTREKK